MINKNYKNIDPKIFIGTLSIKMIIWYFKSISLHVFTIALLVFFVWLPYYMNVFNNLVYYVFTIWFAFRWFSTVLKPIDQNQKMIDEFWKSFIPTGEFDINDLPDYYKKYEEFQPFINECIVSSYKKTIIRDISRKILE